MSRTLQASGMLALALAIVIAAFLFARQAYANPDQILESNPGTATTTSFFMTPGTATTTYSFDTQGDGGLPAKSATLFVALTGSTSATTLGIALEYSQNNQDWFGDTLTIGTAASSTPALNNTARFSLTAGTTTNAVGAGVGNGNTLYRAFTVPVPARYVRAIFSLSSSTVITANGGNGTIWADFIGKKETR